MFILLLFPPTPSPLSVLLLLPLPSSSSSCSSPSYYSSFCLLFFLFTFSPLFLSLSTPCYSLSRLTYKRQEASTASGDSNEVHRVPRYASTLIILTNTAILLQDFKHLLKTYNTRMLWNTSNKKVVMGLYDAYKQAQVSKQMMSLAVTMVSL